MTGAKLTKAAIKRWWREAASAHRLQLCARPLKSDVIGLYSCRYVEEGAYDIGRRNEGTNSQSQSKGV